MARIIRARRVTTDAWLRLDLVTASTLDLADADAARGDWLVPVAAWLARPGVWGARPGRSGVWLGPTDDPARLVPNFEALAAIAIEFPTFVDGRGYSIARALRLQGFAGELRAFGDISREQLVELERVGFDVFELKPGADPELALAAFDTFHEAYQANALAPTPLFRRRVAA